MTRETSVPSDLFMAALRESLEAGTFIALVLGAPAAGAEPGLKRIRARRLAVRGQDSLSFVHRYATRDVTENLAVADGLAAVERRLADAFRTAHLFTTGADIHLDLALPAARALRRCAPTRTAAAAEAAHDRPKRRLIDPARPYLAALGVTDTAHRVRPSMSKKWRQINKFIEIFAGAAADAALDRAACVRGVDFGAGKGYLTFALHDYLTHALGVRAEVTGVELREDLVSFCSGVAADLGLSGLSFCRGTLDDHERQPLDVLIALHACDTATDLALHRGLVDGAAVMLCAPCCHKQLRPQLHAPEVLHPVLRFGVHADAEAEMVTDALRVLLLESRGYDAKVFEFISLEHTSKNRMILAVRRPGAPAAREDALRRVADLKAFYGIREHALETLLEAAAT